MGKNKRLEYRVPPHLSSKMIEWAEKRKALLKQDCLLFGHMPRQVPGIHGIICIRCAEKINEEVNNG